MATHFPTSRHTNSPSSPNFSDDKKLETTSRPELSQANSSDSARVSLPRSHPGGNQQQPSPTEEPSPAFSRTQNQISSARSIPSTATSVLLPNAPNSSNSVVFSRRQVTQQNRPQVPTADSSVSSQSRVSDTHAVAVSLPKSRFLPATQYRLGPSLQPQSTLQTARSFVPPPQAISRQEVSSLTPINSGQRPPNFASGWIDRSKQRSVLVDHGDQLGVKTPEELEAFTRNFWSKPISPHIQEKLKKDGSLMRIDKLEGIFSIVKVSTETPKRVGFLTIFKPMPNTSPNSPPISRQNQLTYAIAYFNRQQ